MVVRSRALLILLLLLFRSWHDEVRGGADELLLLLEASQALRREGLPRMVPNHMRVEVIPPIIRGLATKNGNVGRNGNFSFSLS